MSSFSFISDWQRIERVIRECRTSVLPFALRLGLKRADILYQIKHCERRMTLALAVRIVRVCPGYSLSWLLTGNGVRFDPADKDLTPVYVTLARKRVLTKRQRFYGGSCEGERAAAARAFPKHGGSGVRPLLGCWEMVRSFCLSEDPECDREMNASFAPGEIIWDFLCGGTVVQYESGKRVAEVDYLFDSVSGCLFVEQNVLQMIRLNASEMEFLDCSDCGEGAAAVFVFRPYRR